MRRKLHRDLDGRTDSRMMKLQAYAAGDHPLSAAADPKWKVRADRFAKKARTNYCGLASVSVPERLQPVGFRSGRKGNKRLDDDLEVLWADPERKTEPQKADAALKASQFGVPWATRMADYGKTPQEIARMAEQRADDAKIEAGLR